MIEVLLYKLSGFSLTCSDNCTIWHPVTTLVELPMKHIKMDMLTMMMKGSCKLENINVIGHLRQDLKNKKEIQSIAVPECKIPNQLKYSLKVLGNL